MKNPLEGPRKIMKNAVLATTLAVGMFGSIPDAKAGNGGGGNKAGIENLKQEHIMRGVDAKQLKRIIGDYETSPGVTLDMFLDKYDGHLFTVTESVGQTQIAAKASAEQKLRSEGKVSSKAFTKDLGNGNVSVILVAVEK